MIVIVVLWLLGAIGLVVAPRASLLALVALVVAFDSSTVDVLAPIGAALYRMPPEVAAIIPVTMAPVGWYAIFLSMRLAIVRPSDRLGAQRPLPGLVWLVPAVLLLGVAWGTATGGALNLAYHESRGLIVAIAMFVGVRSIKLEPRTVVRLAIGSSFCLALAIAFRYFIVTRGRFYGDAPFAHESVIFLAIGLPPSISSCSRQSCSPGADRARSC